MNGRKAKMPRRNEANHLSSIALTISTAERMLSIDMSEIPVTRYRQFIVGWLRAAFAQSLAMATLAQVALAHAGAPNRRSFAEIVIRLQWVRLVIPTDVGEPARSSSGA
jgi:hypothetical protein